MTSGGRDAGAAETHWQKSRKLGRLLILSSRTSLEGNDSGARPSNSTRISSIVLQSLPFDGKGVDDTIDDELEVNKIEKIDLAR